MNKTRNSFFFFFLLRHIKNLLNFTLWCPSQGYLADLGPLWVKDKPFNLFLALVVLQNTAHVPRFETSTTAQHTLNFISQTCIATDYFWMTA